MTVSATWKERPTPKLLVNKCLSCENVQTKLNLWRGCKEVGEGEGWIWGDPNEGCGRVEKYVMRLGGGGEG